MNRVFRPSPNTMLTGILAKNLFGQARGGVGRTLKNGGGVPQSNPAIATPPSSNPSKMVATKIDGTAIAKAARARIAERIVKQKEEKASFAPGLHIILVGDRQDSATYVRLKAKAAGEVGITCNVQNLPEATTSEELLAEIAKLNADSSVHGILVQLPLPKHIPEDPILAAVSAKKDVDGLGPVNLAELAKRAGTPHFTPCTPKGIMTLLAETQGDLSGKTAVVIGRGDLVGSPVSLLLRRANATVIVCHTKTPDIPAFTRQADILVAAVGVPNFVQGDWVKPGAVVIDVGMTYIDDPTRKSGSRAVGDVDYEAAAEKAAHITPVPGGVGPMTIAMLMENVLESALSTKE